MNKFVFMLLIFVITFLTACNMNKIEKNVEADYVSKMDEYYKEVQSSIDELNEILNDSEPIKEKINTMREVTSELFMTASNNEQNEMGLVTLDSSDSYNKFEKTREYKDELYNSIFSINQNTTKAAINYDENLISDVKNKIIIIEEILEKAPDQLQSDINK